ncbi:MAG: cell division protein FtsK [Bacteroidetes bacterium 43-93]|nr:DNA translocase FtsK 4TM domain-containing protein [Bacteroidota bacterium]OJW96881.1 MAG: cell division protein FtsK [Bacteroidetes bacterium 43-93]
MAKTKNNKKTTSAVEEKENLITQPSLDHKKQWRLGFGIFFILAGVFITVSIVSYFFNWNLDYDKSSFHTLLSGKEAAANWGGRLGAALSHALVFNGAGIASLAIGIWIGMLGLTMVYGKRVVPAMRYLRWVSLVLLVIAPILAYLQYHNLLPSNTQTGDFPYGGAWGNAAIEYMNRMLGTGGTGMVLVATVCIVAFAVFALDIRPLLHKARSTARAVASLIPTPVKTEEEPQTQQEEPNIAKEEVPATKPFIKPILLDEETGEIHDWDISLVEKTAPHVNSLKVTQLDEDPAGEEIEDELTDEEEEAEELPEITLTVPPAEKKATQPKEPELAIEIIQQEEEPVLLANNGHISLEDNEPYAPELDLRDYKFPTLDLLQDRSESITLDKEELEKNKNQIIQTLRSFGIEIQRISATVGPTVTLYEIVPAEGVRISKIRNLEDDIALNLAALGIRIIAPIPGRGTIGIEVPNTNKQIVSMRSLLASEKFAKSTMSLPIALGKKIDNENYIVDLATMPHLLMAGATGQGKSVGINAILVSLLYKKHPAQLKFVMVDPKKVELSIYRTIEKHFLAKLPNEEEAIITDTKKVIYTLNALCIEMDNRYELLKEAGARNIKEYNEKFINRRLNPQRGHKYLPFIVLVIDEFADLIMTAGKEVEMPIARLAQLARAVGIHLIIATQRPSVNVITGTIKANFPGRIAFKVSAKVDSRTILDAGGAEQLIGRGDMLVSYGSELLRVQCAFVDTPEVEKIVDFIGSQRGYPSAFELPEYEGEEGENDKMVDLTNRDDLFDECARTVVETQSGSTSLLQRRYNLGYNRAGRIMDQLESAGIVGPARGSKPRDVIYKTIAELEQFFNRNND